MQNPAAPPAAVSGRRLLVVLGVWPAASATVVVATLVLLRIGARAWARDHAGDVSAVALVEAYLLLLAALLAAFGGIPGLRDRLGLRYTGLRNLGLAALAWLAALSVSAVLLALLEPLFGRPRSNSVEVLGMARDPLFLVLIVPTVTVLAPLAEELLFRGAIFGWLRGRLPWGAAAVISAALFAGAHLIPPLFPAYFVFGLFAAALYQFTRSTLNTFVMHAGQNTMAVIAALSLLNGAGS